MVSSHDAWQFHDDLVRRWFDASYRRQASPGHVVKLANGLGLPVTGWFEQWISFIDTATFNRWFILRDDFYVAIMSESGIESVSILMQGEGDAFWCIDIEDWHQENPEVKEYTIYGPDDSEEDDQRLYDKGAVAPFLAAFALSYQLTYLHTRGLQPGISVVKDVRPPGGDFVLFGNLQIWETSELIVIRDDRTHYRWDIATQLRRDPIA